MTDSDNTNDQDPNKATAESATPEPDAPEANTSSQTHQSQTHHDPEPEIYPSGIWMRALHMIIFMILFGVAETLMFFMAVFQFLWMLVTKSRNPSVAQFGDQMSGWLRDVGRFQSGATDDKPFPWSDTK